MIHPVILHEMARSAQRDMERQAREASLARAVAPRGAHHSVRARAALLGAALLALAGFLLI